MHRVQLLHAERAILTAELVVLVDWAVHHYRRRIELWVWADHGRGIEEVAVYLPACGMSYFSVRSPVLLGAE